MVNEGITTALVNVNPAADLMILGMQVECNKLLTWAETRTIEFNADVVDATDDLIVIRKLAKAIESRRKEYTVPLDDHKKTIMEFFRQLTDPLERADKLTCGKITAYRQEVDRKRQEVWKLEQDKLDLARREEALTGEHTIDLTPVVQPEAAPAHVYTEAGTLGMTANWKYQVIDFALLPDAYKIEDSSQLTAIARKHHDLKQIPGVRFFNEPSIRLTPKR